MPRGQKAQPKAKVAANGHQLPKHIKSGEILTDVGKRKWQIGRSIGVGGFGEIYCASEDISKPVATDAIYVIKIEPHNNGPLFSELHFYHRVAKAELIDEWMKQKKLKFLGMPRFIAFGSHEYQGERYRFMVMERFGDDLQKLFLANGKKFSLKTVLTLGIKILDVLEYIHNSGYIHADIKASNLLLGFGKKTEDNVYLVDFGLACRYLTSDGQHKEYRPDPRKAHDGTIEYTSRDAHVGAHSRRGDLEILGFNLLHWLYGYLPWEDKLKNANTVKELKESYLENIPELMKACSKTSKTCSALQKYFEHIVKLNFEDTPKYDLYRKLFRDGLKQAGLKDDGKLEIKKKRNSQTENEIQQKPERATRTTKKPCAPVQLINDKKVSPKPTKRETKPVEKVSPILVEKPTPAMLLVMEKQKQRKNQPIIATKNKLKRSSPVEHVEPSNKRVLRKRSPPKYEISPDLF